ncbi:DoxX family protein [Microbulbifer sp. ZKSA002]|uniref:DoxX family protein n=1 Tax=Microbulbifer sp. ZKSA002 TaxID=3243388 RepID=UPI00403A68B3
MVTPIIILLLLSSPLGISFIYSKFSGKPLNVKKYAYWGLGITFIFFCVGHFVKTEGMVEMLPSGVPFRLAIIYLTGLIELLIGIALFVPRYQLHAAWLAIVVFVIFFPANIYAALNGIGLGGHQWGPVYLLLRAPLQIILIAWAYFLCVKGHNNLKLSTTNSVG